MKILDGEILWMCTCGRKVGINISQISKNANNTGIELVGCNKCDTLYIIEAKIEIKQLKAKFKNIKEG